LIKDDKEVVGDGLVEICVNFVKNEVEEFLKLIFPVFFFFSDL